MAKKKEENAAVETEETKAKFREKLKSLLELGKRNGTFWSIRRSAIFSGI